MGRARTVRPISAARSSAFSAPKNSGAAPRSTVARPIVAMITAMIGRPMSGRSTTRSSPKPNATMPSTATATPSQNGAPGEHQHAGDDEAGKHYEFTLREVDRVGGLVDQHEAERDERVHQPDQHAVGDQHQRESPVKHGCPR
jgi:hypothetical protein